VVATSVWAKSDPASQEAAERWLAKWNGAIQRVRGRIEKIFGTSKRSCGFRRLPWRGRAKARLQTNLTAITYKFKRALNILSPARAPRQCSDVRRSMAPPMCQLTDGSQKITIRARVS